MKRLALLFEMSENERRGFLVLAVLIGLIGIVPFIYSFYVKHTADDVSSLSLIIEERTGKEKSTTADRNASFAIAGKASAKTEKMTKLFAFDPNNLPVEQWEMLGFTKKQISVIKNYEAKGGRFRTKADVAKMYVISDEHYERLAPYINLPTDLPEANAVRPSHPVRSNFSSEGAGKPAKRKTTINLSVADTTQLKEIHGIGSVLASRIVKFRDALGGFHRMEQIKEVYGISEEQFVKMEPSLTLGNNPIKKWSINHLSIEQLAQHPYISRKEATHIVRYREQHGAFASFADVEKIIALQEDFLRKIAPYLDFY